MKKYLDILIFTLLFFFLFSYFSDQDSDTTLTGVQFETLKDSYKVPSGVVLNVTNNTSEVLSYNNCDNITLRRNGEEILFPEKLCKDVTLQSQEVSSIDFSEFYRLFEDPGDYIFYFKYDDKEHITQIQVEYRGTIGKLFIGMFYAPIYNLMVYFIELFNNSLWSAIIAVTIVLRILLLFPQHKMMVSQRKMQAIQPKIKKLQEKHKGNQQQMWMELMKLYKDEGVNPMGSCGLLIIQMPILIVIYHIILNITSLRNEFYLYEFLQWFHTVQIDYSFFNINLLWAGGLTWIVLALVVAAIQYIQIRLSLSNKLVNDKKWEVVLEKKKWANDYNSMMPDPELMNKFMLYGMPAMVGVFTYTLIAWVGLYWWISTLFAIFQQLFVNKIIKK